MGALESRKLRPSRQYSLSVSKKKRQREGLLLRTCENDSYFKMFNCSFKKFSLRDAHMDNGRLLHDNRANDSLSGQLQPFALAFVSGSFLSVTLD